MSKVMSVLMRRFLTPAVLSAFAATAMISASGPAGAADLDQVQGNGGRQIVYGCAGGEVVILFDRNGHPTVPARTPYYTCLTGVTFLPGDVPPPPEYCCH